MIFSCLYSISGVQAQTASVEVGCFPLNVSFSAPSGQSSFFWDFKDGATSDLENPVHVFIQAGVYVVEFRNTANGPIIGTVTITVLEKPSLSVAADPDSVCPGQIVKFVDNTIYSSGMIPQSWSWTFGNGSGSTVSSPTTTYSLPGNYSVSLSVVTNLPGCQVTKIFPGLATVLQPPVAAFTTDPDPPISCIPPLEVSFQDQSTSAFDLTWSWNMGNGQTYTVQHPPNQVYTNPKAHTVILTVTDEYGCTNSITKIVQPGFNALPITYKDTICQNLVWKPQNTSPNGSHSWSFSDGANPSTSSLRNPEVIFSQSGTVNVSYTWTSPDKSCSKDTSFTIVVESPDIEILIGPILECRPPFVVNGSTNYTGSGLYQWEFLPGPLESTDPSPTFVYPGPSDNYSVYGPRISEIRLELVTAGGCLIDTTRVDTFGFITAAFIAEKYKNICAGDTLRFFDMSYSPSPITEWLWVWGDGDTLKSTSNMDIWHVYDSCDTYFPRLIVRNEDGCEHISYEREIIVSCCDGGGGGGGKCMPGSSPSICHGQSVVFYVTPTENTLYYRVETDEYRLWHCPTPGPTGIDTIEWTFDHEPGNHPVYFSFYTDLYDFYSGYAFQILVEGAWAQAWYETHCENPYEVTFIDSSMNATHRQWILPDGSTSDAEQFDYTFSQTGDYEVILEVWNEPSGCPPDRDTIQVYIRDIVAKMKLDPDVCIGTPLNLDASASQDVNATCHKGYTWYFPGGPRPLTTGMPIDTQGFNAPCQQDIMLVVEDINGCQDTAWGSVNVQQIFTSITADKTRICLPAEIQLTAKDSLICAESGSWSWSIGNATANGQQSSFVVPEGSYLAGDSIRIRVEAQTPLGCPARDTIFISIYKPVSQLTVDPANRTICEGQSVSFMGTDFTAEGSWLDFEWNFGNGDQATGQSVSTLYPLGGVYPVEMRFIEHATGCDDTLTTSIIVQSYPDANFSSNLDTLSPICHPATVVPVNISDSDYPLTVNWDFGNGESSTLFNPASVYEKGTWTLSLIVSTSAGCADTISKSYTLVGPEGDFELDKDILCLDETLTLTLKDTSDVSNWLWDFGDGTQQFGGNPVEHTYTFLPPDSATIATLVLTDNTGYCSYQLAYPVPITVVDADFSIPPAIYCPGSPIYLENNSSLATFYQWTFSWGGSSNEEEPVITAPGTGAYEITLLAINDTVGCADTLVLPLIIEDLELTQLFGDTICPGDTAIIGVLDSLPGFTISWTPTNTLIHPDSAITQAVPQVTTTYTVTVFDSTGCMATGTVEVVVIEPLPEFSPWDTMVVQGVPVILPGPSLDDYLYSWSPDLGLSCTMCARPELISDLDQEYTLLIRDRWGCFQTTTTFFVDVVPDMIEVPNVFTPNGDQTNSYFQIFVPGGTLDDIALLTMKIYSRWGNLVYDNDTPDTGWDGTYKGEPCPMDVYAYVIEVEYVDGRKEAVRGDITLVR